MSVQFPEGFVKTYWPGYFWHVPSQTLYSIKSGVLTELKRREEFWYRLGGRMIRERIPNYQLSLRGRRVTVTLDRLQQLKIPEHAQVLDFIPYS